MTPEYRQRSIKPTNAMFSHLYSTLKLTPLLLVSKTNGN